MGKLLSTAEVAERLAVKQCTIRKMLYQRRIPKVKIGRCVRVREEDVEALVRIGLEPAREQTSRIRAACAGIDLRLSAKLTLDLSTLRVPLRLIASALRWSCFHDCL